MPPTLSVRPAPELTGAERLVVVHPADTPASAPLLAAVTRVGGPDLAAALSDPEVAVPAPHLILRPPATPADYRAAGATAGRSADPTVSCLLSPVTASLVGAFARGAALGAQRMATPDPAEVTLWVSGAAREAAARAGFASGATTLAARNLANTPSNVKSPEWLAAQAQAVAGGRLRVQTHDTGWLEARGFGGVLAVGRGSARPPNVTELRYRGTGPHIVLVGKGITFDSGGLSLKPPTGMPLMKTDMSGAAAVIAAMGALRDRGVRASVTGLIACAENMPSGSAMRPGDVLRQVGGRTTEVLNTDAEGRLVLADCLAYATTTLGADLVIDVATLTGAATVGLGRQHAALYATDDRLARTLERAGRDTGELLWRMPLVPEYASAIDSSIADAANSATDDSVQAGSITAALFLQPFVHGVPWAHLDIAGTGRTESDRPDCRKGATGFGAALLTDWIAAR